MLRRLPVINDYVAGIAKIYIGIKYAGKSLLAEDPNEQKILREMAKASLVEGTVTTAVWGVPLFLFAKYGVNNVIGVAGFGGGLVIAGIKLVNIGMELRELARDLENHRRELDEGDSTQHILQQVGHGYVADVATEVVPVQDRREVEVVVENEPTPSITSVNRSYK